MKLYFIPFACSLASRIALTEAGLDAEFVAVAADKLLPNGRPLAAVSPMNQVPVLEMNDGGVLTENVAVLTYIADRAAGNALAPEPGTPERYRMQQWLNFVATELHAAIFHPLFIGNDGARDFARTMVPKSFAVLSDHLVEREFLLERFSVADAYLLAVLNWCELAGVDIAGWPVLLRWRTTMRRWPSVAAAMATELPLLKAA